MSFPTYPEMRWSFDFTCPMRPVDGPKAAELVYEALYDIYGYPANRTDFAAGEKPFTKYGSHAFVSSACMKCPANTLKDDAKPCVVGCIGHIPFEPEFIHQSCNEVFRAILRDENLEEAYHRLFIPTQPLWYSFWITSPLGREQSLFLQRLLDAPVLKQHLEEDRPVLAEIDDFQKALRVALATGIPLHVSMVPHGFPSSREIQGETWRYIVYDAACPRCKSSRKSVSSSHQATCQACGFEYRRLEARVWERKEV